LEGWIRFLEINAPRILELTLDHAILVSLAIVVALLIGVPQGIYLTTNEYLAGTILQVASWFISIDNVFLKS